MATRKAPTKKAHIYTWIVIIEQLDNSRSYFELATSEADALGKAKTILDDNDRMESVGIDSPYDDRYEVSIINIAARSVYSVVRRGAVLEKIR